MTTGLLIAIAFTSFAFIFGALYMYFLRSSTNSKSTVVPQIKHTIESKTHGEEDREKDAMGQTNKPKMNQTRYAQVNELSRTVPERTFIQPGVGQAVQVVPTPSRQVLLSGPGRGETVPSASLGLVSGGVRVGSSVTNSVSTSLQAQRFRGFSAAQPAPTNLHSMANRACLNAQPAPGSPRIIEGAPISVSENFGMTKRVAKGGSTGLQIQSFAGFPAMKPASINLVNQGRFLTRQARVEVWRSMEIKSSAIQKGSLLGKGGHAEVFEGVYHGVHGKVKCAVKVYRQMQKAQDEAMEEIKIMGKGPCDEVVARQSENRGTHVCSLQTVGAIASLSHPCILQLFHWSRFPLQMLTELAEGDLVSFYKGSIKNVPYSEVKALRLFRVRTCARVWLR